MRLNSVEHPKIGTILRHTVSETKAIIEDIRLVRDINAVETEIHILWDDGVRTAFYHRWGWVFDVIETPDD